jgi:FkbM family methyltransferase
VAVPELRLVSVTVAGTPLSLLVRPDTVDDYVVREVVKTYRIADLVEHYKSQPSVTIIDIGGHIGSFSVIMATLLPQARVQVFEPVAANFEVLQQNIRHAGLEHAIQATNAGISGKRAFLALDEIGMSPDRRNTGGHAVMGSQAADAPPADGRAFVELLPFGELLDRQARVDILKIDCEGAEFDILYSLTAEQLAKIDSMVGEIHNCFGFAGSKTAGHDWNAQTLKQYLGQHYSTITTDHRLETESAVLETFYARNPESQEPKA